MSAIATETRDALAGIAAGRLEILEEVLELHGARPPGDDLDQRTSALVQIAALVALDAPPASYAWQVASAGEAGATAEDILGVLKAIAVQVGGPKLIAAAPEIMLALGMPLTGELE
jgi:4-carboxymuconolactone decarboxylase